MIPLVLITGFLGSGKTTLLQRLVERYRDRRIAYLVNEFSHVDIDGRRLAASAPNVRMLPGGSIFCTCLVHEFIAALELAPKQAGGALDGVIVEASGVASPTVIAQLLHDTRLDRVYTLTKILSVVDPATLPVLLQSLPNIATQITASDIVLVNKVDLYSEEQIGEAERLVLQLNDRARIVRTRFCDTGIELLEAETAPCACGLSDALAPCRDPNYARFSLVIHKPLDLAFLMEAFEETRGELYRAKGYVPTIDGVYYIDFSAAGFTSEPCPAFIGDTELVFIARGPVAARTGQLVQRIKERDRADKAPLPDTAGREGIQQ